MSSMGMAGGIIQSVGSNMSATGQYMAGKDAQQASQDKAAQMERNAGQLRAVGQFRGEEELRKAELVRSRILAVAGASGAGVMDPTVVNLVGTNAAESSLAAATHRFNAESTAKDMEYQALLTRREGDAHAKAARWGAFGTAVSGFGAAMGSSGGMGMGGGS